MVHSHAHAYHLPAVPAQQTLIRQNQVHSLTLENLDLRFLLDWTQDFRVLASLSFFPLGCSLWRKYRGLFKVLISTTAYPGIDY